MRPPRWYLFATLVLFSACRAHDGSQVQGLTDVGGYKQDLTSYTADASTLKAYRQEIDARLEGSFCAFALRAAQTPSYRSAKFPYRQLKIEEAVAVQQYSQTPELNKTLREPTQEALLKNQNTILVTASALNRLPRYTGRIFRGAALPPELISAYRAAMEAKTPIADKAFISTTLKHDTALSFTNSNSKTTGTKTLFVIAAKSAHLIEGISLYYKERELIYPPGSEFKVTAISTKSADEIAALAVKPLPPIARVTSTNVPQPSIPGCSDAPTSSPFDILINPGGLTLQGEAEAETAPVRFFGPIGDVTTLTKTFAKAGPAQLALQDDGAATTQGTLVIELEDVTP